MVYFALEEQFKQLAPEFSDLAASEKNLVKLANPAVAMSSAKQQQKNVLACLFGRDTSHCKPVILM